MATRNWDLLLLLSLLALVALVTFIKVQLLLAGHCPAFDTNSAISVQDSLRQAPAGSSAVADAGRLQALMQRPAELEQQVLVAQQLTGSSATEYQHADAVWHLVPPGRLHSAADSTAQHQMAIIIPYRDREEHLAVAVPRLQAYLQAQGRAFTIFILEQGSALRFNRGALLNAAVLLLAGSSYDHFVFHDVDTLPREQGGIQYAYPSSSAPLHLTPPGVHPNARYEDFFGGIAIFTRQQLLRVNGYGTGFWGWGREDDNMRERLQHAGMWPPERPPVKRGRRRQYFEHQRHDKAPEVRMREAGGRVQYFEEHPDQPFGDSLIVSSQPGQLLELSSGLNTTRWWLASMQAYGPAIRITVQLHCNRALTPWCAV